MGHSDGALLALMAAAAASRMTKDEPPHVVIDVHAGSPMQKGPVDAGAVAQQQGAQQTTDPLPIVLDSQPPAGPSLQRYAVPPPLLQDYVALVAVWLYCVRLSSSFFFTRSNAVCALQDTCVGNFSEK